MPDLTPDHVRELRRLVILLDHPTEVARAASHRLNARHYTKDGESSPRRFPTPTLDAYERTYLRLLYPGLAGLLDSPGYQALDDYARRRAIRDAQTRIDAATYRAHERRMVADAQVVTWVGLVDDAEVVA